jgi:hypothetical protein
MDDTEHARDTLALLARDTLTIVRDTLTFPSRNTFGTPFR